MTSEYKYIVAQLEILLPASFRTMCKYVIKSLPVTWECIRCRQIVLQLLKVACQVGEDGTLEMAKKQDGWKPGPCVTSGSQNAP